MTDFTLPELGENITAGDVLRVLVKPGDMLTKEQVVLELETDKATIEVPSSIAGQIKDIKVKAGDKVKVGQAILSVEDAASTEPRAASGAKPPVVAPAPAKAAAAPVKTAAAAEANTAATADADLEPAANVEPPPAERQRPAVQDKPGVKDNVIDISRGTRTVAEPAQELPSAPAAPSVRRLARELGVDVDSVPGTGSGGRISEDDVKAHAKRLLSRGGAATTTGAAGEPLPDFSRWGEIERQPMKAIRRKTAEHLSAAWASIPHVTQHDLADITGLEELRKRHAKRAGAPADALSLTAIAVKVVATALKAFPQFNASIDMAADEIIQKKYVNIGVAVDTDRGLLVPVIRGADAKTVPEISAELAALAEKARTRKITLDEMQGGTFSISNLGGIGGTAFTPIVNAPEVAILGIARARVEPVFKDGQFAPRLMLPLALSYDHRVIDGADGARFIRWVAETLEQPFLLTLQA